MKRGKCPYCMHSEIEAHAHEGLQGEVQVLPACENCTVGFVTRIPHANKLGCMTWPGMSLSVCL